MICDCPRVFMACLHSLQYRSAFAVRFRFGHELTALMRWINDASNSNSRLPYYILDSFDVISCWRRSEHWFARPNEVKNPRFEGQTSVFIINFSSALFAEWIVPFPGYIVDQIYLNECGSIEKKNMRLTLSHQIEFSLIVCSPWIEYDRLL